MRMFKCQAVRVKGQRSLALPIEKRNRRWSKLSLSKHAASRIRQRGIRIESVYFVVDYGRCRWRNGALVFFMDKQSRRAAQRAQRDQYRDSSDNLNFYVVVSRDGSIITVANRLTHLKWN